VPNHNKIPIFVFQDEAEIPNQNPHTSTNSDWEYGGSLSVMRSQKHFQNWLITTAINN